MLEELPYIFSIAPLCCSYSAYDLTAAVVNVAIPVIAAVITVVVAVDIALTAAVPALTIVDATLLKPLARELPNVFPEEVPILSRFKLLVIVLCAPSIEGIIST